MTTHGAKFTRKKEEAIAALLTHRGIEEAAKSISIGTQTLLRWLKVPEFDAAYRAARRAACSQATARLQQATGAAVSTLLKVMVDANTPPSTKVRAADSILDHAKQAIDRGCESPHGRAGAGRGAVEIWREPLMRNPEARLRKLERDLFSPGFLVFTTITPAGVTQTRVFAPPPVTM